MKSLFFVFALVCFLSFSAFGCAKKVENTVIIPKPKWWKEFDGHIERRDVIFFVEDNFGKFVWFPGVLFSEDTERFVIGVLQEDFKEPETTFPVIEETADPPGHILKPVLYYPYIEQDITGQGSAYFVLAIQRAKTLLLMDEKNRTLFYVRSDLTDQEEITTMTERALKGQIIGDLRNARRGLPFIIKIE